MLGGILKPTTGQVSVRGRVSALIELGAGFHPEFTGRENIYINGVLLGLTRAEIRARFDEIVAFAGLESFVDSPVKTYSSGMYMRLGFRSLSRWTRTFSRGRGAGRRYRLPAPVRGQDPEFKARGKTSCRLARPGQHRAPCDEAVWLERGRPGAG